MKKIFIIVIIFSLIFNNFQAFSQETFKENYLYYFDTDNNGKIDLLQINFNKNLTGSLNLEKIFFYSNTGGLSISKLDSVLGNQIISNYYLSGNILGLNLFEQDNYLTGLIINNTISSHLRLKTNAGIGIKSIDNEEIKFLYTTSFDSYKNVIFKEFFKKDEEQEIEEIEENIEEIEEETGSGEIIEEENLDENTNSGEVLEEETENLTGETLEETNSGEILSEENNVLEHQIKLLFQSPSYLLEKDKEVENYNCDRSKTDCKVNFNLNIDEGSGFKSISTSKYECIWDFGFGEFEEEKNKCNPNTIVYPIGEFETKFKIVEKLTGKFSQKNIFIKNEGFKEEFLPTKTVYIGINSNTNNAIPINISTPEIVVQSGLDENGNCKNNDCSVNVIYNQENSKIACIWDFPRGNFDIGNDKKCNPTYVKYPIGDFKITLKVYEIGNESNYKENYLYFSNKQKEIIKQEIKEDIEEVIEEKIEINPEETQKNYTLKIRKVLPNPIGTENLEFIEIENFGNEEVDLKNCSLDDIINSGSKPYIFKESLILKPNQTQKFYKYDTKININNSGIEEINLFCNQILIDNLSFNFPVPEGFILSHELNLKNVKNVKKQKNKNIYEIEYISGEKKIVSFDESFDAIYDLMKKDLSLEEKKQKLFELVEKSFYQKISKQKSGIKIYGTTIPNTKIIFKLEEKNEDDFSFLNLFYKKSFASNDIFETKSGKSGNYEFYIKKPNIGEFEVKTFLNFGENNLYELPKKSSLEVDLDYLEYINSSKNNTKIKKEYINPKSVITLQGKLTSNKTFKDNKLVCLGISECSVNLDGSESLGEKLKYFWDFGNGKTFQNKNPSSYKFGVGKHIISLKITDGKNEDINFFIVEVTGKKPKEKPKSTQVEIKTTKNNKIDIIQTANAGDIKKIDVKTHIFLSLSLILIFILGALVLLKRKKII